MIEGHGALKQVQLLWQNQKYWPCTSDSDEGLKKHSLSLEIQSNALMPQPVLVGSTHG